MNQLILGAAGLYSYERNAMDHKLKSLMSKLKTLPLKDDHEEQTKVKYELWNPDDIANSLGFEYTEEDTANSQSTGINKERSLDNPVPEEGDEWLRLRNLAEEGKYEFDDKDVARERDFSARAKNHEHSSRNKERSLEDPIPEDIIDIDDYENSHDEANEAQVLKDLWEKEQEKDETSHDKNFNEDEDIGNDNSFMTEKDEEGSDDESLNFDFPVADRVVAESKGLGNLIKKHSLGGLKHSRSKGKKIMHKETDSGSNSMKDKSLIGNEEEKKDNSNDIAPDAYAVKGKKKTAVKDKDKEKGSHEKPAAKNDIKADKVVSSKGSQSHHKSHSHYHSKQFAKEEGTDASNEKELKSEAVKKSKQSKKKSSKQEDKKAHESHHHSDHRKKGRTKKDKDRDMLKSDAVKQSKKDDEKASTTKVESSTAADVDADAVKDPQKRKGIISDTFEDNQDDLDLMADAVKEGRRRKVPHVNHASNRLAMDEVILSAEEKAKLEEMKQNLIMKDPLHKNDSPEDQMKEKIGQENKTHWKIEKGSDDSIMGTLFDNTKQPLSAETEVTKIIQNSKIKHNNIENDGIKVEMVDKNDGICISFLIRECSI